jgi:predicted deacetylase
MLLVSIHDVTPALEGNIRKLWDLCAREGIKPALFVVPNWHGRWPLEEHSRFVRWIRARADEGAELVLHGERHDEAGSWRRLKDSWRAWGRTAGEGEFLSLDEPAARDRIGRALARLRVMGFEPTGFVAPAWLAREDTDRAAGAAGLAFTEDAKSIHLLCSGRRIESPVVRWSSRSPARAWGSVAVAAARWRLQRNARWPRLALHPQDLNHPATTRSLQRAVKRWCGYHVVGQYADLCAAPQPA